MILAGCATLICLMQAVPFGWTIDKQTTDHISFFSPDYSTRVLCNKSNGFFYCVEVFNE